MAINIVFADGIDGHVLSRLKSNPAFHILSSKINNSEDLKSKISQTEILVVRSATKVTADLINSTSTLKMVIRAGEGLDNIDQLACSQKGIQVANTPGVNTTAAAELTLGLILNCLRRIPDAHHSMKEGLWQKNNFSQGIEVQGLKVGILGLGRIGGKLCSYLCAMGAKVFYFDLTPAPATLPITSTSSIDEIFASCQLVSVHLPSNNNTKKCINYNHFKLMSGGILVNASRGDIVCQESLLKALDDGHLQSAALDVFEEEPLPPSHPLRSHPKILTTPHIGASTTNGVARAGIFTEQLILNYAKEHR